MTSPFEIDDFDEADANEREIDCECDGEGCDACSGFGKFFVETFPRTLDDIETEDAERAP